MGFLSNLFGRKKEDNALRKVVAQVRRILDDEEFQLEFVNPAMKVMLESAPAYDKDPNGSGSFGFSETNPIPVNGPIGQLAYLSRLEDQSGQRILFHRLGAINAIDVFEAVTFDGNKWFILFLDYYHPRRSRLAPEGFRFTKEVPQFSGFHNYCENFPYDFIEKKAAHNESGLSIAYIAVSRISKGIQKLAFNRPLAHNVKLELIKIRLSSSQEQ